MKYTIALMALSLIASQADARSRQARAEFVRSHPCPTGQHKGCAGYVVDHVVPLCAGGADEQRNMQWQTVADGKVKDRAERALCRGK